MLLIVWAESFAFQSSRRVALASQKKRGNTKLFASQRKTGSRTLWREPADPKQHIDFIRSRDSGGFPVEKSRDNLIQHYVYFLRLDSQFCFVFNGMAQVHECRRYFSRKIHPHTRNVRYRIETPEHSRGPWYCRLPKGITETKRQYILKQLHVLIERYGDDFDFVHEKRYAANKRFDDRTDWIAETKKRRALYQETLLQQLRERNGESIDELVWTAIEQETCRDRKSKKPVKEFLESQVRAAQKVVNAITPLSPSVNASDAREDDSVRPLSKRRQKMMEQQRVKDVAALEEVGRPISRFFMTLKDTREAMEEIHQEEKGSCSEEFQPVLEDLKVYQRELESVRKSIGDLFFDLELRRGK